MEVIARFQFYFPFVLPRGHDWPSSFLRLEYPALERAVMLRPRPIEEDLFPDEIDRNLAGMSFSLTRISQPSGSLRHAVRDRCLDRIEVRVEGRVAALEDVTQTAVHESFESVAIRATNSFLEHCRVLAEAPFVTGVEMHYRLQDDRYYMVNPHTVSWFRADDGSPIPAYEEGASGTYSSGAFRSPERGQIPLQFLKDSLSREELPPLELSLLMDAEEHLVLVRFRECILSLASALEVASNLFIARNARARDPVLRRILNGRASFAEKRFHQIADRLSNRSLKMEEPGTFELVKKIYQERNAIIHGTRDARRGAHLGLSASDLRARLEAARGGVAWLSGQ